jgi:hypothetical protein
MFDVRPATLLAALTAVRPMFFSAHPHLSSTFLCLCLDLIENKRAQNEN